MKVYTLKELDILLNTFLPAIEKNNVFMYSAFQTMYNIGARFSDVYNDTNWFYIDENFVQLSPQKGNDKRLISSSDIDFYLYDSIVNHWSFSRTFSYSNALNMYHRLFPGPTLYVKNKPITTHLFRHTKAKILKQNGKTDLEIKTYLGERSQKSANDYIYSSIYSL